ncbi:hypothetical protein M885DRAFT_556602 [Pelagophyceae sp. CCMP2097]|nr:hypothetical protein M885DRAFT_556602 [Pelagophyceae sp. CCMP2097]
MSRRSVFVAAPASFVARRTNAAPAPSVDDALRLFNSGDYDSSRAEWEKLLQAEPESALYLSNLGTCELIVASAGAKLGEAPRGAVATLLAAAVLHLGKAADVEGDPLTTNNLGNAFAVLLDWPAAATAYDRSAAAAAVSRTGRGFQSIPLSNRAQVALELGDAVDAEKRIVNLLRRDPNFVDGRALLAAVRWSRGDTNGAEEAFSALCRPAIAAPNGFNKPIQGLGGSDWCELYSKDASTVQGRWTPKSIAAFEAFTSARKPGARVLADSREDFGR